MSRPIPIRTTNIRVEQAYPSPVSPTNTTGLVFNPTRYLSQYILPAKFADNYVLGEELGYGGFGFVFSAMRLADGLQVACKFIFKSKVPATSWINDRDLGRCPIEVAVIKNIKHENIIEFVDYFEDTLLCYCITEIHGTSWSEDLSDMEIAEFGHNRRRSAMDLFECIEKYESFTEPAARYIFKQILKAIAHLHHAGLVHRDIKDENILIDDQFRVKLIDFGSAQFFDRTGRRKFNTFLGTKQYASPEILMQREYVGPEAEIWALGCCLYIILSGAVPFSSAEQALSKPFSKSSKTMSDQCLSLLERMLEKDPKKRATLQEVLTHNWVTMNY
ncbi:hypothetical protein HDV01_003022 [Terramyces sp. JEL0728]|nr:hypothetical protein HDV01_003022 [Terramyces sp. JEL0728]